MKNRLTVIVLVSTFLFSCTSTYKKSLGGDTEQRFTRLYLSDFNTTWQSLLEVLKSYRLDVTNKESGMVLTRWTDNTLEKNFVDSFGSSDAVLKAQIRFRVNLSKGYYNGAEAIRVTVQKDQVIQRDVLEGWKLTETDAVDENTFLYRLGRIIFLKTKFALLEKQKLDKQVQQEESAAPSADDSKNNPDELNLEDLEVKLIDVLRSL